MNARENTPGRGQRGFSLVELLVAMAVTLVVSGSIYGLLTAGQNAFRREPSLADRQQNIRIAMDSIARDVDNAGAGMPVVSQVFTHTDAPLGGPAPVGAGAPYLNGGGPKGVLGAPGEAVRGGGATGAGPDTSDDTDILEMVGTDPNCPAFRLCNPPAATLTGAAVTVDTREQTQLGTCLVSTGNPGDQGIVLLTDNRQFTIQPATLNAAGNACGGAAGKNGDLRLGTALPEWPLATALSAMNSANGEGQIQAFLYTGRVVRYMIAPGLDPADTSPGLWRSESGRYTGAGAVAAVPAAGATNWQLIARGIEDLQVEYLNAGGLWANNPGIVSVCPTAGCTVADYNRVVRQVRITLSARALEPRLQGETQAAGVGPNAVRGQLVSVISPRAAVVGLQVASNLTTFQ